MTRDLPRLTVLQPESFVPLDRFARWLDGVELDVVNLEQAAPPAASEIGDGLLVLGGRMNAVDDAATPWLPAVHELLRDAVAAGIPTFGICLGHQLLAHALSGEVACPAEGQNEEGAVTVRWSDDAARDPLVGALAATGKSVVAESHDDAVVRLPDGAVLLASSDRCPVQAFRIGSAVGVQFHPEASPELMEAWTNGHGGDGAAIRREMEAVDDQVAATGQKLARAFVAEVCRHAGNQVGQPKIATVGS